MKPQLKSSPAARELIQRFEPYRELAAQGSDGRWRVGFGHRAAAREGVRVSRDDASLLLLYDVMQAEAVVDEMFTDRLPDSQRDALTSYVHDIGAAAFRSSDVARYMFEGRIEAAAEALAASGEGDPARREAEAAMILAGLAPAKAAAARKPAMVDVVIKVEHAADAGEPAAAAPVRPALPDSIMPPPPPVMTAQHAARREAEREIARILATVGAMPQDTGTPLPDMPEADPVIEAAAEAGPVVDPADETASEPVADDSVAELEEAAPDAIAEPDAETRADMPAPEADETGPEVAAEIAAVSPDADTGPADASAGEVEPEPEAGAEPAAEPGVEAELETGSEAEAEAEDLSDDAVPASAQVIARMSREIAKVQTAVVGRQESVRLSPVGADAPPGDVSLGYAFTGAMSARFNPEDLVEPDAAVEAAMPAPDMADAVEPVDEFDAQIEDVQAVVPDPDPAADSEPVEVETEAEAEAETEADADDAAGTDIHAAAAIVGRSLAVSGERTPPPHPAETPAPSEGAVGDIAGDGGSDESGSDEIAHHDELAGTDTPNPADTDDDETFSPHDLVGSADMFVEPKPASAAGEEDGWGFLATLIAGLVVTAAGVLDVYGDWPRVWVERDPTWGVLAAVAGGFLVITAGWMLSSVLAAKRRRRAG
ncbi:glycoside hydrolase family protein [Maricaulis sp.]|uniref:glycoside hydrolase family protein n=1 Tax=Maricaulis sp. TaxID=1486257 RepID=UPI003A91FDB7